MKIEFFLSIIASLCLASSAAHCENSSPNWPQFRGPLGNGVAQADDVPVHFGEGASLRWKTPLPGRGWSSPVTKNGKVWMTSAVEKFPSEEERLKILKARGVDPRKFRESRVAASLDLLVLEVDLQTGRLEKEIKLKSLTFPISIHPVNSYASPTPVLDDEGKLYAHFGTMGTWCVDTGTGEIIWHKVLPLNHSTGPGSSPFLYENLLILICDGVDRQYVAALDKQTGRQVWKTNRPEMRAARGDQKKSFCTPILIKPKRGAPLQLICMGAQWMISYDPASGKEIWRLDHGNGFSVVPRPVFSEKYQLLYFATGFGKPQLWAVHPDGTGDITGDAGKIMWKETRRIPARPSPLVVGDDLYVISDGGIATCFDAKSGAIHWTERIDGNFSASPLWVDDHLYFCSQEGSITVLDSGKEFKMVAENHLDDTIMASPIAFDGALLVRGEKALYRFGK